MRGCRACTRRQRCPARQRPRLRASARAGSACRRSRRIAWPRNSSHCGAGTGASSPSTRRRCVSAAPPDAGLASLVYTVAYGVPEVVDPKEGRKIAAVTVALLGASAALFLYIRSFGNHRAPPPSLCPHPVHCSQPPAKVNLRRGVAEGVPAAAAGRQGQSRGRPVLRAQHPRRSPGGRRRMSPRAAVRPAACHHPSLSNKLSLFIGPVDKHGLCRLGSRGKQRPPPAHPYQAPPPCPSNYRHWATTTARWSPSSTPRPCSCTTPPTTRPTSTSSTTRCSR